jgi:hypothetical protein
MDFEERKVNKRMLLFAEPSLGEVLWWHLNFPDNVVGDSNPKTEKKKTHFIIFFRYK